LSKGPKKGIITDLNWKRIKEKEKPKGIYFLRYTKTPVDDFSEAACLPRWTNTQNPADRQG